MWRTDAARRLPDRVEHLLAKLEDYPNLRYVWAVGDSADDSEQALRDLSTGYPVTVIRRDTGIKGDGPGPRLRRLSLTGNVYFEAVQPTDDYLLIHESDIISPPDLVNRMVGVAQEGYCPLAGWPVLELAPGKWVFYDIFCYRRVGRRFRNEPPYHACYRHDRPFEVDSFGTVFLMAATDAPRIRMETQAVLDICEQLRGMGRTLWVDPRIVVEQPHELWEAQPA